MSLSTDRDIIDLLEIIETLTDGRVYKARTMVQTMRKAIEERDFYVNIGKSGTSEANGPATSGGETSGQADSSPRA